MSRVFVYDGREHPDPDPALAVEEVKRLFSEFFPEVATAEVITTKRGEDEVVEFKRRVGTKG
ncbi:MAG: PRTRC system protein C [Chloroflexi bacterium]|nr:PRTRC system protein C [Chloroflexota bacterium]